MLLNSRSVIDPFGPPNASGNYPSGTISRVAKSRRQYFQTLNSTFPAHLCEKIYRNGTIVFEERLSAINYSPYPRQSALNCRKLLAAYRPIHLRYRPISPWRCAQFSLVIARESKLGCHPRRWSVILRFEHWTRARIFGTSRCESRKRSRGAPPHVRTRDAFRSDILEISSAWGR